MKTKIFIFAGVIGAIIVSTAFGAGSVRINPNSVRAGTMNTTTANAPRMALSKTSGLLSKKLSDTVKVKESQTSKPTAVPQITTSDIRELESRMTSRMDNLETSINNLSSELSDLAAGVETLPGGSIIVTCPKGCSPVSVPMTNGQGMYIVCKDKDGNECREEVIDLNPDQE